MTNPHQPDGAAGDESYEQPASSPDDAGGAESSASNGQMSPREILESVLRQTLSAEPDAGFFQTIVRFAARNRERKITQPEVAEALVEEILETRFGRVPLPDGCAEWVAESLLDDPDARDRLKRLWASARDQANAN